VNILKKKKKKKKKKIKSKTTYSDISDIVEYLVNTKSRTYTFDCWTHEDIAQEIRIICFKALAHFDVSRVEPDKWKNFFGRCVDNGLKNLKRDNYIRNSPPCKGDCGMLHGDEHLDKDLTMVCKRWLKFRERLQRKIRVLHPIPIDFVGDIIKLAGVESEFEAKDLEEHILSHTPKELKRQLKLMIDGKAAKVPRKDKQKIREFVERILD